MTKRAFVIVDVQNDFVEGGALGVTGGNKVASGIQTFLAEHRDDYDLLIFTLDWHIDPGTHWSETPDFVDTWPVHCAAGTQGAQTAEPISHVIVDWVEHQKPVIRIIKGIWSAAYSGFEGIDPLTQKTLAESLRDHGITSIDVAGIATDHCVRATALDGLTNDFEVRVIEDLVAGVAPEPSTRALDEIRTQGGNVSHLTELAF